MRHPLPPFARLLPLLLLLLGWSPAIAAAAAPAGLNKSSAAGTLAAHVKISPQGAREPLTVELSSDRLPPELVSQIGAGGPHAICGAIAGQVTVNDIPLCSAFGPHYVSNDRVREAGDGLTVAIRGRIAPKQPLTIQVGEMDPGPAPQLDFTVTAPPNREIVAANGLPRRFSTTAVSWSPGRDGRKDRLLVVSFGESHAAPPELRPRSWKGWFSSYVAASIARLMVGLLALFIGFALFTERLIFRGTGEGPRGGLAAALLASSLLGAAYFLDLFAAFGSRLGSLGWKTDKPTGLVPDLVQAVADAADDSLLEHLAAAAEAVLLVLLLATLIMVAVKRRGRTEALRAQVAQAAVSGLLQGAWLAWAGSAIAILFAIALPGEPPFEPLALAVSLALGAWIFWRLAPLLEINWKMAAVAALLIASTLLYPQDPIASRPGVIPPAASNIYFWFLFLCEFLADGILLLLVFTLALYSVTNKSQPASNGSGPATEPVFLFALSIALYGITNIINAVAFLSFVWLINHVLMAKHPASAAAPKASAVAPKASAAGPKASAGAPKPGAERIALLAGGIAAAVLWVQLAYRDPSPTAHNRFFFEVYVLSRAAVPAAIGALLLYGRRACLPGRSAFAKALFLTGVGLGARLAAHAEYIIEHRTILPALVDTIPLASALLLIALVRFDLGVARAALRGKGWREKLGDSGFEWLVTAVTGLAAAIASAASPIIFKELGNEVARAARDRFDLAADRHEKGKGEELKKDVP